MSRLELFWGTPCKANAPKRQWSKSFDIYNLQRHLAHSQLILLTLMPGMAHCMDIAGKPIPCLPTSKRGESHPSNLCRENWLINVFRKLPLITGFAAQTDQLNKMTELAWRQFPIDSWKPICDNCRNLLKLGRQQAFDCFPVKVEEKKPERCPQCGFKLDNCPKCGAKLLPGSLVS